jgi:hypothetical protein
VVVKMDLLDVVRVVDVETILQPSKRSRPINKKQGL